MKNISKSFKLASPFKVNKDETSNGRSERSSTSKSTTGNVGGYEYDVNIKKVREVNRSATSAKPDAYVKKAKTEGPKMPNEKWKQFLANETPEHKKKRLADAEKEKTSPAPKGNVSASGDSYEDKEIVTGTPRLTERKEGTSSDTFTSQEKRQHLRQIKRDQRGERQEGKQASRRLGREIKSSNTYKGMTGAERKAVKSELKGGRAVDAEGNVADSSLDKRFGEGTSKIAETARRMHKGGGELNRMNVKQQAERAGEAEGSKGSYITHSSNPGSTIKNKDLQEVEKYVKGGDKIKASPDMKEYTLGENSSKGSSTSSKESAPSDSADKPDPVITTASETEETAKELKSVAKFMMKGFGAKAGYDFSKNKK
jgi:hypothetical protein